MFYDIFEEFRTEKSFSAWVEKQKRAIRELAFKNRSVIDKRSLEMEIEQFSTVVKAWKPLKELRRESKDFGLYITIDRKGYHRMVVTFPVTRSEIDEAAERRREIVRELGRWGGACCSLDECVYKVMKNKVDALLPFAVRVLDDSFQAYEPFHGNGLIRKSNVTMFK